MMKDKMTIKEFLDKLKDCYDAYYDNEEGFDNLDDVASIIDLSLEFYEQHRGKYDGK